MRKVRISLFIAWCLCLVHQPSWATRAFVSDSITIMLRTGASIENKIIATLSSGDPVEILETQGGWARVRVLSGQDEGKEGWALTRFLIEREPWEAKAKALMAENASLKEKLTTAKETGDGIALREKELASKFQSTSEALKKVQADFDALRAESSDFLKLKEAHNAARASLEEARRSVQELTEENENLRSSQRTRWFLTGALVFFVAWFTGLIIGRREKKRRGSLGGWSR